MSVRKLGNELLAACARASLADVTSSLCRLSKAGSPKQTLPPFKMAMARAAYNGHSDILGFLLANGSKFQQPSREPWNPSIDIETPVADIPEEWQSAIMPDLVVLRAVVGGKPSVVQTLMNFGLKVDHEIDKMGPPLAIAVMNGKVDMVRFLLDKGADPNGMYWIPPHAFLVKAASLASPEILNLMLERGADVKNSMALMGAAEKGRIESAKILLDRGAEIDEVFRCETIVIGTALHVAVHHDKKEFVSFLLKRGARGDLQNGDGLTAKDLAALEGKESTVRLFE